YDLAPEMSAAGIRDAVVAGLGSGDAKLVVVNFANADMVGHTGVIPAAVAGIEAVDACMGPIRAAVREAGGLLAVTADHGEARGSAVAERQPQPLAPPHPVAAWDPPAGHRAARGRAGRRRAAPVRSDGLEPSGRDDRRAARLTAVLAPA